jgi:hypothetical protein
MQPPFSSSKPSLPVAPGYNSAHSEFGNQYARWARHVQTPTKNVSVQVYLAYAPRKPTTNVCLQPIGVSLSPLLTNKINEHIIRLLVNLFQTLIHLLEDRNFVRKP